jgi:hypothetical protein
LANQKCVLGLTKAVVDEIHEDYGIPTERIRAVRMPLSVDLEIFRPSPMRKDEKIRLLFVGNDLSRKGGDVLLSWFQRRAPSSMELTMMTSAQVSPGPRITVLRGLRYGTPEHAAAYREHDLLVLPTRMDSYPSALAEAACSGLGIVTSNRALGAPEVVLPGRNGAICGSDEAIFSALESLATRKPLVEAMKATSRELMEQKFADSSVVQDYLPVLFG